MSTLLDLPDLLGAITFYLESNDINNLWGTGNNEFHQNLRGGIPSYRIQRESLVPIRLPSFLSKLSKLQHMVIDSMDPDTVKLAEKDYGYLPPSITSLMLKCDNAGLLVAKHKPAEHFPLLRDFNFQGHKVEDMNLFMSSLPPTLTRLKLNIDRSNASFDPLILPSNLTMLELRIPDTCYTWPLVLPSSLTAVKWASVPLESFPPNLQIYSQSYTQVKVFNLPSSITDLRFNAASIEPNADYSHLNNLRILQLHQDIEPQQLQGALCKNLTGLTLETSEALEPDVVFAHLPPLLKQLRLHVNYIKSEHIRKLPASLMDLALSEPRGARTTSPDWIQLLPPHLTTLRVHMLEDSHLHLLPRTITWLDISGLRCKGAGFSQLPPQLDLLVATISDPVGDVPFRDQDLKGLPNTLRSFLLVGVTHLTVKCGEYLPHSLTSVNFELAKTNVGGDELLKNLPPNLVELRLSNLSGVTDGSIPCLPRTLRELELHGSEELTDQCVPHLPRGLVYLNLRNNGLFSDECAKHLPRSLARLILPQAKLFTSKALPDFPDHLRLLNLRDNTNIKLGQASGKWESCALIIAQLRRR